MAWVHDSGYELADAHVGYPAAIQIYGAETASSTMQTPPEVIGWRLSVRLRLAHHSVLLTPRVAQHLGPRTGRHRWL